MNDLGEQHDQSDQKDSSRFPVLLIGIFCLILYPFSIPFYLLIGETLPAGMYEEYLRIGGGIYAPLAWLNENIKWVESFYDWYEQFFPWW